MICPSTKPTDPSTTTSANGARIEPHHFRPLCVALILTVSAVWKMTRKFRPPGESWPLGQLLQKSLKVNAPPVQTTCTSDTSDKLLDDGSTTLARYSKWAKSNGSPCPVVTPFAKWNRCPLPTVCTQECPATALVSDGVRSVRVPPTAMAEP
eukprot:2666048-Prymnesium_polylepis.3